MSPERARDKRSVGAARFVARASLRNKLAILTGTLSAVVVCGAFWILSIQTRASARRLTTDELIRGQRTLVALQRRAMDQLSLTAALITQRPNVGYALSTYRLERDGSGVHRADLLTTITRELRKLRLELDADVIAATDEVGRVVVPAAMRDSAASPRLPVGSELATLPAVRSALDPSRGDIGGLSVLRLGGAFYQVAVAPVILDGFTLGTLLIGEQIDSRYLARLRDSFDGEVVVASDRVIATSLRAMADSAGVQRLGAAPAPAGPHTAVIGHDEFVVATLTLGETQSGAPVRLYLLQPLTPKLRALSGTMLPQFVTYGALAVVVAVLGALLLARASLAPLDAFVRYIREGADAERLGQPFDASNAAREVRALHASFDQLMTTLDQKRRQLELRTDELTTANTVLTDEMRERERVERALRESEAQLRQSQKLEAIGTLAGGVAHDFNNLLTVISGFTQLALMRVDREHPATEELRQVLDASNRAAKLTHQLLAFSRKQVLQPRVVDVRTVVDGIEPMLRRLIGEHIELRVVHGPEVAEVKVDPGQLEQVLMNLVVNARDAMPDGGRLTVETGNVVSSRPGHARERRVALRVSDTGVGMPPEIRERIFEPFFTTKGPGKGTGLGLSTVYGIVQQSGGLIDVATAPGRGTTFTIELPRTSEPVTPTAAAADDDLPTGTETVLLVEDEDEVRCYARRTLEQCGYAVLAAANPVDALALVREHGRRVDALLTDVVMPHMTGPQLVARLAVGQRVPCIVYMSGYADDAILQLEIDPAHSFLRKPFTPFALARAIRDALDARRRTPHALSTIV